MKKKIDMKGRPKKASQLAIDAISKLKEVKDTGVKNGIDLVNLAKNLAERHAEGLKKEQS